MDTIQYTITHMLETMNMIIFIYLTGVLHDTPTCKAKDEAGFTQDTHSGSGERVEGHSSGALTC